MPRFFLSAYTVRVRNPSADTYEQLGNFDGQGSDLFIVFNDYLQRRRVIDPLANEGARKVLRVTRSENPQRTRNISGIIEAGDYGFTSRLYDTDQNLFSYNRRTVEAELLPYFFITQLPRQVDEGVLVLQRTGQYGIRTLLSQDFDREFSELYPSRRIEINPLIPQQMIQDYLLNGRIAKIRLVKFSISSDIAENYDVGDHEESLGYEEHVIVAQRRHNIPLVGRIREFLNQERNLTRIVEIQNFEYNNVKIEVELNGNRRTIDLSHLERLRAQYDVTEDVEIGPDGHPTFASIDNFSVGLLNDISAELRVR